jgi:hypothetical protein
MPTINLSVRLGHGSVAVRAVDDLTTASVELTSSPGARHLLERFTIDMVGPMSWSDRR